MKLKRALALVLALVLSTCFLTGCGAKKEAKDENQISIQMSITCKLLSDDLDAVNASVKDSVPKDGVVLKEVSYSCAKDTTVYDATMALCKEQKILAQKEDSGFGPYFKSFANIGENAVDNMSGWGYKVNGKDATVGCGEYKLQDGDTVEWYYFSIAE